jgi:tellurite resistance protein
MYHKKAKLFLLLIAVSIQIFAQLPDPNAVQCGTCSNPIPWPTSVPVDVKPTDACYPALKNLIEKYAVDVSFCSDGTFNPEKNFTNGMWLNLLGSTMFRIREILSTKFGEDNFGDSTTKEENFRKFVTLQNLFQIDLYNHHFEDEKQIKDVKENDECYSLNAACLMGIYKIDFTNKEGLLDADERVNVEDVCKILKQIWYLQKFDEEKYTRGNISKADFIILFNDALEEYSSIIEDYEKEKLKK